jgi:serine protease AprX
MATKRVVAYALDQSELGQIKARIKNADFTDSFAIGELDEQHIQELKSKGIIIESVQQEGATASPARPEPQPGFWQAVKSIFTRTPTEDKPQRRPIRPVPKSIAPMDPGRAYTYLVTLKGPLVENWRQQLDHLEVTLLEFCEGKGYTARLKEQQLSGIRGLDFVAEVRFYEAADTEVRRNTKSVDVGVGEKEFDIRCHSANDREEVVRWLEKQGGATITAQHGSKVRVNLAGNPKLLDEIPFLPEVAEVEEYVPPKLYNDLARRLIGIDGAGIPPSPALPFTGAGQIVGVADTGLDNAHPDLAGNIAKLIGRGRPGDASDLNGHGTHVCGSIIGNGSASNGAIRGTAPEAKCVFQSVMDGKGKLGGLPADLGELFEEAYQLGARIHNNSWGSNTEALYTFSSREVDEFVDRRRDMLVVIAAGNEGSAATSFKAKKGFVDWSSMSSPATAKNALSVGACRSSRQEGGFATAKYGEKWPRNFKDPPIKDARISGDDAEIAGFSSRGPCDDRRIKPDLVAPGTDILSARASTAPTQNFWGLYTSNDKYAFMGGTSMATPLVSGCAALVREYYTTKRNVEQPSAALLKATLINSTTWLTGSSSIAEHDRMANYHQGYGRINMANAIPDNAASDTRLAFVDDWKDEKRWLKSSGSRFRFFLRVKGGKPLRICLVWTDAPGRGVQNALGLVMDHQQTRERWFGNQDRADRLQPDFDRENNVQVIRLPQAPEGDYLVHVVARNLLRNGQDFALVAVGALSSDEFTRA